MNFYGSDNPSTHQNNHKLRLLLTTFSFNPWFGAVTLTLVLLILGILSISDIYQLILLPFYFIVALYGSFNVFVFALSWRTEKLQPKKLDFIPQGIVTMLYLTYNDFKEDAFKTVLGGIRHCDKAIIVDDSTDPEIIEKIDNIAKETGTSVIRREIRSGFKAGAINNALKKIDSDFIGIVDSDEMVPIDFVSTALPYFTSEEIAFVQVSHRAVNNSTTWEKYMGYGVDMHWKLYHPYRNHYGVVNFLGHGAILRRSAVLQAGGFPEIVAEDIGLTTEFYILGKRGVFVDEIKAGEDFPNSYSSFRKRHKKWTMGSTEFMRHYLKRILKSDMAWYEKLDIIVPSLSLPMTLLLFIYIMATSLLHIGSSLMLFGIALLSMGAPNLGFARMPLKREIPKTMAINALAYVSLFPTSVYYAIKGLIKPVFLVTGEHAKAKSTRKLELAGDIGMGLFLIYSGGFSLLGIVCLLSGFLFLYFN